MISPRQDNNSPARVFTRSVSPQGNPNGKMLRGVLGIGMRDSPVRKPPAEEGGSEGGHTALRTSHDLSRLSHSP